MRFSHQVRRVTSVRQLRRWVGQVNKRGTYMEELHRIAECTLNNFKSAIDAGMIVYDVDLRNRVFMLKTSLVLMIHDLKHLTGGCRGLNEITE